MAITRGFSTCPENLHVRIGSSSGSIPFRRPCGCKPAYPRRRPVWACLQATFKAALPKYRTCGASIRTSAWVKSLRASASPMAYTSASTLFLCRTVYPLHEHACGHTHAASKHNPTNPSCLLSVSKYTVLRASSGGIIIKRRYLPLIIAVENSLAQSDVYFNCKLLSVSIKMTIGSFAQGLHIARLRNYGSVYLTISQFFSANPPISS